MARLEPKKKPRSAYRRFVYPAPNACWQLDATEYVLTGGRKCVIFQLQDDHSRVAVATHIASAETAEGALAVVKKGITAYGVPQKLLTDNGMALNPSRRGWEGQLLSYVISLGVEAITGKPGKPTTQGKNERFHQTLFRFLDKQPIAESIEELQTQVDEFDAIYNTQRRHQGLPGRITPAQAWDATAVAQAPRPAAAPEAVSIPGGEVIEHAPAREPGQASCTVHRNGVAAVGGLIYHIGKAHRSKQLYVVWDAESALFADDNGEVLAEYPHPPKGVRYVAASTRLRA